MSIVDTRDCPVELHDLDKIVIGPGQVLVLRPGQYMPRTSVERLMLSMGKWGEHRRSKGLPEVDCIVLPHDCELFVVGKEDLPQ